MIPGSRGNIKITHKEDLEIARHLLAAEVFDPVSAS